LRELAPGKYEAYIRVQIWSFTPGEIRIPAGSTVTFYATSQDVQHGVKIANTNINMMILPGQVSKITTSFDKPGTYNFICHEYCGSQHHTMYGRIIVEDPNALDAETATVGLYSLALCIKATSQGVCNHVCTSYAGGDLHSTPNARAVNRGRA
jgi:plastocyanin